MNLLAIVTRMLLVFAVVWIVATIGGYSLIVSLSKQHEPAVENS